jgi:ZIP family zinc transporter
MEILVLLLAASGTALATGLGAIPVSHLGTRAESLRPVLWGLTIGLMTVASVVGLLLPGLREGSTASVVAGLLCGVGFLLASRRFLSHRHVVFGGASGAGAQRSALVFLVLLVHSLPEGFAVGTAYASSTESLGLYVILAIALQNIPEGTSVAIPMDAAGSSGASQFWAAVGTSAPQPLGALIAYGLVTEISNLLPFSFGFAAGAMLSLVVVELTPEVLRSPGRAKAAAGTAMGAALMLTLAALLGP